MVEMWTPKHDIWHGLNNASPQTQGKPDQATVPIQNQLVGIFTDTDFAGCLKKGTPHLIF